MKTQYYQSSDFGFDQNWISRAALDVVKGLHQAGFDGYLVGGCVRDLLFGKAPKDFDVTTNASPEEVRQIFRRSRIIGRRFRIVHVRFGREIIEVATYRANPNKQEKSSWLPWKKKAKSIQGRILDDNVYGTIEEDAERRDFTANALYYDPFAEKVTDFLGGVEDIQNNQLKMIGDPIERFAEDPVRMLRVVRFQAKLQIAAEEKIQKALAKQLALIDGVPPARLFDEVLKMFHHAHGVSSWQGLAESGLSQHLFPEAFDSVSQLPSLEKFVHLALENTDRRIRQNKSVIPAFLFAVLLWGPFCARLQRLVKDAKNRGECVWRAGDETFAVQCKKVAVPRRVSTVAIEVWFMQDKLEQRRPKSILPLLENKRFRAAYDFLMLRGRIGEVDDGLVDWWRKIQELPEKERLEWVDDLRAGHKNHFRRTPGAKKKSIRRRRPKKQQSV